MHHKKQYPHSGLIAALIASMVTMAIPVRAVVTERPRLVLGIVVDGLDREYVEQLMEYFGEGGFKRLSTQGVVIENADFGTPLSSAAATSVIMTGASPSVSGITADVVFDYGKLMARPVLADNQTLGNYTTETYSPVALRVSTIGDELKIAGAGTSLVYSIAPDANQAIILAGHAANNASWLNDDNANWATTTYYRDVPTVLSARNRLKGLSLRLDTMQWSPSSVSATCTLVPDPVRHYPFRHVFGRGNEWRVPMFKNSPLYNTEAISMASDYVNSLRLGRNDGTDMLALGLSAQPFEYTKNADARYELVDSYIKLDHDLASLFDQVDSQIGLKNTLIFLAGTPPRTSTRRDDPRWRLPYGEYSPKKAKSLLNLYLIALHGNGEWVSAYHGNYFYLNRGLIKERNLDLTTIQQESADFLKRMSGVLSAYPIGDIIDGHAGENAEALRRNTDYSLSGDIMVEIAPGWAIVDVSYNTSTEGGKVVRGVAPFAPIYILAPDVTPTVIGTPVDARAIAPTVTRLLRIRSPNGASLPGLRLK